MNTSCRPTICKCGHPDTKHHRQRYRPVQANWACAQGSCRCLSFEAATAVRQ